MPIEEILQAQLMRTEDALRESVEEYRNLFGNMNSGFAYHQVVFDENGTPIDYIFMEINKSFEKLTGLTRDIIGKRVTEVHPGIEKGNPDFISIYGQVALTGVMARFDAYFEPHQQWYSISAYCPKKGFFVAIFDNVTERKHNEAEKEKLEAQLQQAMKMEAVGRLTGGIAHDFNNLLTVILGYSELIQRKVGNEFSMFEELEEIRLAGERATLMTQQLLSFSRAQVINSKLIQLNELIAEMEKMISRLINEDIIIQVIPCSSLGIVKIDPGQFQQILMNLVVNARDAMPNGGKLMIETANVDLDSAYCVTHPYIKPGRFVMMAVSDTGTGMSVEVKARLFEPFFTTKEPGRGTGLGLTTIYDSIKRAGGSIEVYSEVEIGTTIKVYLPCVEEKIVESVNISQEPFLGGTETVLVVEDESMLRNLCVRTLRHLGYNVVHASNHIEAIKTMQSRQIDLLLTDVVLPGMNGAELAARLVKHRPKMKVLFMSGYTKNVIVHHGVLADGINFIEKPFTPTTLAMKVREVINN